MIELSEQQIIDQLSGRLVASYQDVEPAHVARIVLEEYARFDGRPIRDFVPLFVERHAREALSKLSAADDPAQRETVA
jgi:hypothetical protein